MLALKISGEKEREEQQEEEREEELFIYESESEVRGHLGGVVSGGEVWFRRGCGLTVDFLKFFQLQENELLFNVF